MSLILLVVAVFCLTILSAFLDYLERRSDEVLTFRWTILSAMLSYERHSGNKLYWDIPPYDDMLYKFWRSLTFENWLSQEQLDQIGGFLHDT